jgi:hypothetical protein
MKGDGALHHLCVYNGSIRLILHVPLTPGIKTKIPGGGVGDRSLEISVANVVDHHGRFIEQETVDRDRKHDRVCNEAKAHLL